MAHHHRVCPYWVGFWLLNPLRRFRHNPEKILSPLVQPGFTVLEVGPGMGYFTLPLARMVGSKGKIIAVDVQEKMIRRVLKRAESAHLTDRIVTRVCPSETLAVDDYDRRVDFALAFAVVHEVPDASHFFQELHRALKPGARVLVAEPAIRVSSSEFEASMRTAQENGFSLEPTEPIAKSRVALLKKE